MVIVDNSIIASRDYGIVSIEILPHNICRVTALSNIFFNQKREIIRENIINNIDMDRQERIHDLKKECLNLTVEEILTNKKFNSFCDEFNLERKNFANKIKSNILADEIYQ